MILPKPVENWLYIEKVELDRKTAGGVVLDEKPEHITCRVVAAGPGRYQMGVFVETSAKAGDYVLLNIDKLQAMLHGYFTPDGKLVGMLRDEGGAVIGVWERDVIERHIKRDSGIVVPSVVIHGVAQ